MEQKIKHSIALFFLSFFLLSSCNSKQDKSSQKEKIMKDFFGRNVAIPTKVERILPIYYIQAEFLCAVGASSRIVGVGKVNPNSSEILNIIFPKIHELPVIGIQSSINYEKIISLKPDLIFTGTEKEILENLERFGLNVVATYPNNLEDILDEVLFYGEIVQKKPEADRIYAFLKKTLSTVAKPRLNIPDKNLPKVYYIRTDPFTTLGGELQGEIFNLAGGDLVTKKMGNNSNSLNVSLEDIYKFNPDIIVIRDRASVTPDDIYKDVRWQNIKAVKDKKVFQETNGWTEFRFGTFFGIMEKAKWFHPKEFTLLNPTEEYETFLNLIKRNNEAASK